MVMTPHETRNQSQSLPRYLAVIQDVFSLSSVLSVGKGICRETIAGDECGNTLLDIQFNTTV